MSKKKWLVAAVSFAMGFLAFAVVRMAAVKNHDVHYHANFGLFVNGQRDTFDNFTFYEEVASCSVNAEHNPKHLTHMHDNKFDVVHVHGHGATWGGFFSNLGYTLGNSVLVTPQGRYIDGDDGKQLRFILNGKEVETVQNREIESTDTLLIAYGEENDTALQSEYKRIDRSADRYNKTADPAACSGSEKLDLKTRFKRAFNFSV